MTTRKLKLTINGDNWEHVLTQVCDLLVDATPDGPFTMSVEPADKRFKCTIQVRKKKKAKP
jgi:hypothetical protein